MSAQFWCPSKQAVPGNMSIQLIELSARAEPIWLVTARDPQLPTVSPPCSASLCNPSSCALHIRTWLNSLLVFRWDELIPSRNPRAGELWCLLHLV